VLQVINVLIRRGIFGLIIRVAHFCSFLNSTLGDFSKITAASPIPEKFVCGA
jgi:hypothetical protein